MAGVTLVLSAPTLSPRQRCTGGKDRFSFYRKAGNCNPLSTPYGCPHWVDYVSNP